MITKDQVLEGLSIIIVTFGLDEGLLSETRIAAYHNVMGEKFTPESWATTVRKVVETWQRYGNHLPEPVIFLESLPKIERTPEEEARFQHRRQTVLTSRLRPFAVEQLEAARVELDTRALPEVADTSRLEDFLARIRSWLGGIGPDRRTKAERQKAWDSGMETIEAQKREMGL